MKNHGAWIWLKQGAGQLGRSRASAAILAIAVAISAAFFSAVLVAFLMLGGHYPAGATDAPDFLSLGQSQTGKRHDAVDLNHFAALAQLPAEDGEFFAANVGSSYPLESSAGKALVRTGFASAGFLSELGVELIRGRWPARQEVALSQSQAKAMFGSVADAIGQSVKIGAMDGVVSGVFADDFEGLHPAWDQSAPTSVWISQDDIFVVSGFSGRIPEDVQRQIPLFRIYLKPSGSMSARRAAANATQLLSANGMNEKWEAVPGVYQGLAEHDAMTTILAPASIALVGLVLALLLAQIAHEARTIDGRARTVMLRGRLGATWARIAWQEAMTAMPLATLFGFVSLIAASLFLFAANTEAVVLTQASPYTRDMLLLSVVVPVIVLPLLPVASRLLLLVLLRGQPTGAPPRLALAFLSVSVALGLLSSTLLLALSGEALPLLEQVGSESRNTTYVAVDRTRSDISEVNPVAVADLAASLRRDGIDVDVASSAPFSKCDQLTDVWPSGGERTSAISVSLVSLGVGTSTLLGLRLQEGAVPDRGEVMVTQSVSIALGSAGGVGSRITLQGSQDRRISGVVKDAIFDAPSSDSAMRVFATDIPSACPSFLVVREVRMGDVERSISEFEAAFGAALTTNRAERAMQRLYAPIMLARATLMASIAVLMALVYLIAEALLAFLAANTRIFATMQSLGASALQAGLQTVVRIGPPIAFAILASTLPLLCFWYLLSAQNVLRPAMLLQASAVVLVLIVATLLTIMGLWHRSRAWRNISDMLKDE